jgi:hypothetical protein
VETASYVLLGVLVVAAVAMQVWIARSSNLAGDRSGTVLFIRIFNIVLLVGVLVLVIYALTGR